MLRAQRVLGIYLNVFWVPLHDNLANAPSWVHLGRMNCLPPWVAALVWERFWPVLQLLRWANGWHWWQFLPLTLLFCPAHGHLSHLSFSTTL